MTGLRLGTMNEAAVNGETKLPRQHPPHYITELRAGLLPSGFRANSGSCALFVCPPLDGAPPRRLPAYKRSAGLFVCFSLSRLA